ncbi:MAG: 4-hydroxythreonine-4-phosphate dehydrogenase PdxA [Xanthomonadales bacterium]|nr:4-hydroxythreonine-4-phosphate dehydrogenase PdxA [Xanthomonadales bacterium]
MIQRLPVLAVTPGDPAGIGPEVVLKAVASEPGLSLVAVADPELLAQRAADLDITIDLPTWDGRGVPPGGDGPGACLPCVPVELSGPVRAGVAETRHGPYVLATLDRAVELVRAGAVGGLVTGPVNKALISASGRPFSGHTEYLAGLAGVDRVVMMLANRSLRVALVTTHLPLSGVPAAITAEAVEETIRITVSGLQQRFDIARPRVQVLGLNPHAGEDGQLGHEDTERIAPAIQRCADLEADVTGPVPADTAFTQNRLAQCDAVVAMYHDQGLPVVKHAGFGDTVNVTLGLPFVRTSVDHGTAFDIAAEFIADPSSLVAAARLASRMVRA